MSNYDPTNTHDSEDAVLGMALCVDEALARLVAQLQPWHFAESFNRSLFELLSDLYRAGGLSCAARLQQAAVELQVRLRAPATKVSVYLGRLIERTGWLRHAHALDWHLERIRSAAQRRDVMALAKTAFDSARDPHSDPLRDVRASYDAILERGKAVSDVPLLSKSILSHLDARLTHSEGPRRLSTGLTCLDAYTGGLEPSELIILAGMTGFGKSAMAIQMAAEAAQNGLSVAYHSLEITADQISLRLAANRLGIPLSAIYGGTCTKEQRAELAQFSNTVSGWRLAVYDRPKATIADIERISDSQKSQMGLDLVVVDLLGLVTPDDTRANKPQQYTQIAYGLKALAKTFACAVIATVQLNRNSNEPGRADMHGIKDSAGPAEAADMVMVLAPRDFAPGETKRPGLRPIELKLDKIRRADRHKFAIGFDAVRQRFETPEVDIYGFNDALETAEF